MREHGVQIQSWACFAEGRNDLFTNPLLAEIGKEHGKSVARAVLRRLTQRGVVAIPKSVRAERMAENFDVLDFRLTDEQMVRIATLGTGGSLFFDHRDPEIVAWLAGRRLDSYRRARRAAGCGGGAERVDSSTRGRAGRAASRASGPVLPGTGAPHG